jgi:2-polyprenyl-3-methyl-5-hydroxy-6-metoxy-1,4-benzoquinol methylase
MGSCSPRKRETGTVIRGNILLLFYLLESDLLMDQNTNIPLVDTGERMIPTKEKEVSIVFSRHLFTYQVASNYVVDKIVLDIGCGTGYGSHVLAQKAKHVIGLDQDASAIAYCKMNYSRSNIEFIRADASNLPPTSMFDVVVIFQVIEHIADIDNFVVQVKKRVKPGGKILMTTPNSKESAGEPSPNPFHVNEMNYDEFSAFLGKHFRTFTLYGIGFASQNRLRKLLFLSPLYRLGKLLKRGSTIKKLATQVTGTTKFRLIEHNVLEEAIDLFAICIHEQ